MDRRLEALLEIAPWEWPDDAGETLLEILRDPQSEEEDLATAVELAAETMVMSDKVADALVAILRSPEQPDKIRARAAISLGPALELTDTDGFEEPNITPISDAAFRSLQDCLRQLYGDTSLPPTVRRAILEASVRAPQDWHGGAVRAAASADDPLWRLTALFCMGYVRGFEPEIVAALDSDDSEIHYEAVRAAGNWGIAEAWPHVEAILTAGAVDKELLLAAIEAAAGINPEEAPALIGEYLEDEDEEIANAAAEAIMACDVSDENDDS